MAATSEPWGLRVNVENIPQYLRDWKRWLVWVGVHKANGKIAKVPRQANKPMLGASVNNTHHWSDFSSAVKALDHGIVSGVGFVLTRIRDDGGDLIGIDLDRCVDEDGDMAPWAADVIDRLGGYWELSPSGHGLRGFVRGELPGRSYLNNEIGIELYDGSGDSSRYVTVTGRKLGFSDNDIPHAPADALVELYEQYRPAASAILDEDEEAPPIPEPVQTVDYHRALADVEERLSDRWLEYLETHESEDHSRSLLGLCIALYSAGLDDDVVYATLVDHFLFVGEKHWPKRSTDYLWLKCCVPAKRLVGTDAAEEFEDVTEEAAAEGREKPTTAAVHAIDGGRQVSSSHTSIVDEFEDVSEQAVRGQDSPVANRVKPMIRGQVLQGMWDGTPPAREWLVDGWLAPGHTTLLYGDGGTGKSLLAQQLQTCMSLGVPWLGMPVPRVKTLGLYCEDDGDELWRRQEAINTLFLSDVDEVIERATYVCRLGLDNALVRYDRGAGTKTKLWASINAMCAQMQPRLLVLDTVSDFFLGNEVDRGEVTHFMAVLNAMASKHNMAVLLLAHPSAAGRERGTSGSTAWENRARGRWHLYRDEESDLRVLENKKANYAAIGGTVSMKWEHGAWLPASDPTVREFMDSNDAVEDALFLDLVRALQRTGRPLSDARNGAAYAPRLVHQAAGVEGRKTTLKAMEESMARLLLAGRLRITDTGRRRELKLVED